MVHGSGGATNIGLLKLLMIALSTKMNYIKNIYSVQIVFIKQNIMFTKIVKVNSYQEQRKTITMNCLKITRTVENLNVITNPRKNNYSHGE